MGSWRYSGSTHITEVLLWVDTVSSVWAGQEYEGGRGRIPSDVKAAGMCGTLCLGMDNETTDGLCLRMRRQTNTHDVVVEVCNGLPHHKWKANDVIFRQLEETSHLHLQGTWTMLEGQESKTQVNWEISGVTEGKLWNFLLEMLTASRIPSREVEGLGISSYLSSCPLGTGGVLLAQMPLVLFTPLVHKDVYGPV